MSKITDIKNKIFIPVILIFLAILANTLPNSSTANAETNSGWSWLENPPTVVYSKPIANIDSDNCQGYYTVLSIAGEAGDKLTCMYEGSGVKFGTYMSKSGYKSAVTFLYDGVMHQIDGFCADGVQCLYLPDIDALAAKQAGHSGSLFLYKNFKSRLKGYINVGTMSYNYTFDRSNPTYIFKNKSGIDWNTGSISASKNGKWLIVELTENGIGLLNTDTLEMKQISSLRRYYGRGMDPVVELAISNNGQTAAIMGQNAGIEILDGLSDCGKDITSVNTIDSYIAQPCQHPAIDFSKVINVMVGAYHPRFSDDGAELNIYAKSAYGFTNEALIRAGGYNKKTLDYLAMGDSYSSGQGETDDSYYLPGTNSGKDNCHNSTRSYPYLIVKLSNINPESMRSVACSGAVTKDIAEDGNVYYGQGDRLKQLDVIQQINRQTESKLFFTPGVVRQDIFANINYPRLITIGIGGNDIGFMEKLQSCLGLGSCNWATDPQKKEQTALEIKSLFSTLLSTYASIHESSPDSKIYAVGYPKIIDENSTCNLKIGALLSKDERKFMNEGISYVNQVVKAASERFGIKYLDIEDSYGDNIICGSAKPSAVNDIAFGDDIGPIDGSRWLRLVGSESFHPNAIGHIFAANAIDKSVGNLFDFNYCADLSVICPNEKIVAPAPSEYWIPAETHDYPRQQIANFVTDIDILQKQINLISYSLTPESTVNIELNSIPRNLGEFKASDDGSLNVSIKLPDDTEEGFHTIHIYGTSFSGTQIDLYQVIKYLKPEQSVQEELTIAQFAHKSIPIQTTAKTSEKPTKIGDLYPEVLGLSTTVKNETLAEKVQYAAIPKINGIKPDYKISIFALLLILIMLIGLIKFFRFKRAR